LSTGNPSGTTTCTRRYGGRSTPAVPEICFAQEMRNSTTTQKNGTRRRLTLATRKVLNDGAKRVSSGGAVSRIACRNRRASRIAQRQRQAYVDDMMRDCPECGRKNRIGAEHLAVAGKCGACKAAIGPVDEPLEVDPSEFDEVTSGARVPV